ncbi:hypothetical protein H5410_043964 [Solanum commersonii]|uniref:Uncharacterized protein n=1 Tax=Solanum commersonii TaxID=4109 RepID=A0A9J5Y0E1_SOLCO|nr:hypothetical protein H5410_043964 [Solanum commersonii]
MKTFLFVICLIFICSWPGHTNGIQDVARPEDLQREVIDQMNVRKLLPMDATVDYDEAGPNFNHTPGGGYPPIRIKNAK